MATTSGQVGAVPAATVTTAAGRVATGNRFSWSERVDGTAASTSVGARWRPNYDDDGGYAGFGQDSPRHQQSLLQFTPLIARTAWSYPAGAPEQSVQSSPRFLLTDWIRGVAAYELNMRIWTDNTLPQGSLINRYS
jgi:hypothetical protein